MNTPFFAQPSTFPAPGKGPRGLFNTISGADWREAFHSARTVGAEARKRFAQQLREKAEKAREAGYNEVVRGA